MPTFDGGLHHKDYGAAEISKPPRMGLHRQILEGKLSPTTDSDRQRGGNFLNRLAFDCRFLATSVINAF